ncbi:MAG: butyrate kinase [Eubacteriales bacterium]
MFKLLIINPGSTSTKIGVFEDENPIFEETIRHASEKIAEFETIASQYEFRKELVLKSVLEHGVKLSDLSAIVARGGLVKPIQSGIYEVNDALFFDLSIGVQGQHASNLGGLIAKKIADELGIKAYIADPVVVDEMDEIARITGVPELKRASIFHALNQKAVARLVAKNIGKKYEDCNFIVIHLGGGVSVGAHKKGKVVDVNNALLGDGPFSPERAGTVPSGPLINLCYSGFAKKDIEKKFYGKSGMAAYLGTSNCLEVTKRIEEGDEFAAFIYEAMAYNIAKEIGAMATVLSGEIDRIIITGGIAYDGRIVKMLTDRIGFIGKVELVPGEEEIKALVERGLQYLRGEIEIKHYV